MKDPCIRQLLRETRLAKYISDPKSKIVEEMELPAASARIDMAVINGHLHGYEIKSASDTLNRLPGQIEAYTKVFDYVSVVTEGKYYNKILENVPSWVGVYLCYNKSGQNHIKVIRSPRLNRNQDPFFLEYLLWKDDLLDLLNEKGIPHRKKDRNWLLAEAVASHIKTPELSKIVRGILKKRANWKEVLQDTSN